MSDLYNIKEAGEDSPRGPYSLEQLQEIAKLGDMSPDTLITLEGSKGWIPINQIPAVKSALFPQKPKLKLVPAKDKPIPPPPPPPSQKSRPDNTKQPPSTPADPPGNPPPSQAGEVPPPEPQAPESPTQPETAPEPPPPPPTPVADNSPPPPPPPPQAPAPDFKREALSLWGIGLTIGGLVAWIIGFSVPVLVFLGVFALVYSMGIFMLAKFFSR